MARRRAALFLMLAVTAALWPSAASGFPQTPVAVDHWVYEVLDRYATVGLLPLHAATARPLSRVQISRYAATLLQAAERQDRDPRLSPWDVARIRAVAAAFPAQRNGPAPLRSGGVRVVAGPSPTATVSPGDGDGAGGWLLVAGEVPGSAFWLDSPVSWLVEAGGSSWTVQRQFLERTSLSTQLGSVGLMVGRERFRWGTSTRGALLLSDNAGPLDAMVVRLEGPSYRLIKVAAAFDRGLNADQRVGALFGTRLDYLVSPSIRLGFNEVAVTTLNSWTPYHALNPLPMVLTAAACAGGTCLWGLIGEQTPVNFLGVLEVDVRVLPGARVYAEYLVDDIAAPGTPNRLGGSAGIHLVDVLNAGRADLRLEYTMITNWTYNTPDGTNYVYGGRTLGHWLGPDGEDIALTVGYALGESRAAHLVYAVTRHGEGRPGKYFSTAAEGIRDKYLSGVVEVRHSLRLELLEQATPWGDLRYWGMISRVRNRGNISAAPVWERLFGLEIRRKF